ncbi:hypothetical protein L228DRAFT_170585 [Xylona heveae TC161]|uniref:Amino acid transporter transmembrane domain-containing protein n=1 Tax=Xylona heveae (strain CBS 132557 / TC161) TaxID=1328760 RepID=A0A165FSM6_XYLHT|nr:hypothetical protein L228DRAFT_170585 [Xylona heveae TC161]KZF21326.1 hypothetical protein L228DRAFT_170585 [Xylona heveae TC161]
MSMRINSIRQAGGVNSIDNFARSWQRAAGFFEIAPVRRSFASYEDEDEISRSRRDEEASPVSQRSLIREQLEREGRPYDSEVGEMIDDGYSEAAGPADHPSAKKTMPSADLFPHIGSPFAGSYGTSYGTLGSRANEASMRHAAQLWREQQETGRQGFDKEREPLLVKAVEQEDGKVVNVVVGQSTLPQTVFNSVNVLIGVGILSLPLGIQYAGWLIGMGFLLFSAVTTSYTARLLAKCLDVDGSLVTFADLAYVSFGPRARIATSILFSIELVGACVALVILFADSLNALIPGWDLLTWKIICGLVLTPLGFVPLRFLSFTSVLGILCTFGIVLMVFVDGFIKPHTPGSLREPAATYLFPQKWSTLPMSFGLLMAPWGGHSVFPNIYKDMRHPHKYNRGVKTTFIFTYLLDLSMAVAGLLMFGDLVLDEVTSNILMTKGYPQALSICIVLCIAIIPITKAPLNSRPIVSTIEILAGLDARAMASSSGLAGMSGFARGSLKVAIRLLVTILYVIIAIVCPSFDRVMALMGNAACFTVCIILPCSFYLKIFGAEISLKERILNWFLIISCSILATIGTVWAFLPNSAIDNM